MFQIIIAILYGLAVLAFAGLSTVELWRSNQKKWVKIVGTAVFGGMGLTIVTLTLWLVDVFKHW